MKRKTSVTAAALLSALLSAPLAGWTQQGTGGAAPGGSAGTPGTTGTAEPGETGTAEPGTGDTGFQRGTDGATTGSGQTQGEGNRMQGVTGGTRGTGTSTTNPRTHRRVRRSTHRNEDNRPSGTNLPGDTSAPGTTTSPAVPNETR